MAKYLLSLLAVACLCAQPHRARATSLPASADRDAEQLYAIYLARDYFELEAQLRCLDPGAQRREFFDGQLDAAFLRDGSADKKLRHFLELPGMQADWRKEAWRTLGDTQLRRGNYETAVRDLARALAEPTAEFTAAERTATQQNLALAQALRGTPPQSRSDHEGISTVNITRDTIGPDRGGFIHLDVRVNGWTDDAILDTGANFNAASASFARRHKLRFLPGESSFSALTGKVVPYRVALADEVKIGKFIFQHVVFCVLQDEGPLISYSGQAIDAIVGSPLIIPLGHLRVAPDGNSMEVGLPSNTTPLGSLPARNLAFDGLCPLVKLQYRSQAALFFLDTGAAVTTLSVKFGQRFPYSLAGSKRHDNLAFVAAGGAVNLSLQILPQLELSMEGTSVLLHDIAAFTEDQPAMPPVLGNVGEDFLAGGFELDFYLMHLSVAEKNRAVSAVSTTP